MKDGRPAPILFTVPNFETAGSGRALFEVARRLDRALFAPSICVARGGGRLAAEVEAAGIPLFEAPFTVAARPLLGLAGRVRAAAAPFAGRFDLWHSLHYLDDYSEPLIARAAGARFVFTKKNMSWNRRSWLLRSLLSVRIAAQNRAMMRDFFGRWPLAGRTTYLPRGVDHGRFAPTEAPAAEPGARLRVGLVAHLLPVKGQDLLVEAAARLPQIELHLAGRPLDADYHRRLVARIAELGIGERVFLHGEVTDVPAFLQKLDVFVLASRPRGRMEGCPVALLEAMAAGLPVLAPAIAGAEDLLAEPGCGILLPAEDLPFLERLGRELAALAEDPGRRRRLGDAARRWVLQEFAIEKEVSRHERLYREMLGG
jgi:glycosyltransferase involved in cell wall biosynthesis